MAMEEAFETRNIFEVGGLVAGGWTGMAQSQVGIQAGAFDGTGCSAVGRNFSKLAKDSGWSKAI